MYVVASSFASRAFLSVSASFTSFRISEVNSLL